MVSQTTAQRPIKAFLGVAADVAMPVLDVLEPALALVPIPGLGLIPKTLSNVLKNVERARVNAEARKAFIAQVEALGALIARIAYPNEALAHSGSGGSERRMGKAIDRVVHSDELIKGVHDLESTMKVLETRAIALAPARDQSDSIYRRCIESIRGVLRASRDAVIIAEMQRDLTAAVEQFRFRANAAIDRGVQEVRRLLLEAEEDRILEKLCSLDVGYRTVSEPKSQLMEGTRVALLEELHKWSTGCVPNPTNPKRVYLLSGGAGMGKSAAAYRYCVQLSDPPPSPDAPRLGASIFIDRNRGGLSVEMLSHALARQLAESLPVLRPHILDGAREYLKKGQKQLPEFSFKELLSEPLSRATAEIPAGLRLVVVIDGLDECDDQPAMQECIKRLLELIDQSPWLYLFLASRPIPRVMALLEDDAGTNAVHHYDLQQDLMNRRDVRMFLESTVPRIPKYASFLEAHPGYLKRLVDRAGGLFIFARIALNVLNQDLYRNNPEEGFQVVLSSETGLDKMDALYLGILRAAFPPRDLAQSPRLHARLLSFLHVIALLATPQQLGCVALFADAIYDHKFVLERVEGDAKKEKTLTIDDFRPLVDLLRSVIYADPSDGSTVPIHISFYEFLVDRCSDPYYHVDERAGHAGLAIACLQLVSITSLKDIARSPSLNPTLGGDKRSGLTFKEQALLYACNLDSLRRHLRNAAHKERTMDAVHATITTTAWVPCWMRICAVRQSVDEPHRLLYIESIPCIALYSLLQLVCNLFSLPPAWGSGCMEYTRRYIQTMLDHRRAHPKEIHEKVCKACLERSATGFERYPFRSGKADTMKRMYDSSDGCRAAPPQWFAFLPQYKEQWKEVWRALEEDPVLESYWYGEPERADPSSTRARPVRFDT
ncbi:hypothetical protein FKP32DRAFT_1591268 [Trametes sanguinea]|nr:hypothetical protein FKP32DRAFT_1591268 [Trametes sanguinea]